MQLCGHGDEGIVLLRTFLCYEFILHSILFTELVILDDFLQLNCGEDPSPGLFIMTTYVHPFLQISQS